MFKNIQREKIGKNWSLDMKNKDKTSYMNLDNI